MSTLKVQTQDKCLAPVSHQRNLMENAVCLCWVAQAMHCQLIWNICNEMIQIVSLTLNRPHGLHF